MDEKKKKILITLIALAVLFFMFSFPVLAQEIPAQNVGEFVEHALPLQGNSLVWFAVAAAGVIFSLFSIVVVYHWFRYAFNPLIIVPALVVYFGVAAVLFGILLISAATLT